MSNEMLNLDDLLRDAEANREWEAGLNAHCEAFRRAEAAYEVECKWADAAIARGDKFRGEMAHKAAWRKFSNSIKAAR